MEDATTAAASNGLLTKDQILTPRPLASEIVEVPEWGGSVRVTALSSRQRDAFEKSLLVKDGKKQVISYDNVKAKLLSCAIVDSEGNRIFSDADMEALGQQNGGTMSRVYGVAAKLSGLTDEDVEELVKNSAAGPQDSSS